MAHCADHSGLVEDLARSEAEIRGAERDRDRLAQSVEALELRVRGLEVRVAAWAGAAALLGAILPRVLDALTPTAHALVAMIGG